MPENEDKIPFDDDLSSELNDLDMGDSVPYFGIRKYNGRRDIVDRFAIIGFPPFDDEKAHLKECRLHYDKILKYIYCFRGECCRVNGLPKTYYLIPSCFYQTSPEGKVVGTDFEIQFLRLPYKHYKYFKIKQDNGIDVRKSDYLVSCNDPEYQDLMFNEVGESILLSKKKFREQVYAKAVEILPMLPAAVARKVTPEEFKSAYTEFEESPAEDQDLDDVFGVGDDD